MSHVPKKILIDGIDRLGKSTLIENILKDFGYYLVTHYDKPKYLPYYGLKYEEKNIALREYQFDTNRSMFEMIKNSTTPQIFDRTHLGELVYAPMYRGYSGEYVFEFEKDLLDTKPYTTKDDVKLILLTTSNFNLCVDDGLSFNFENKEKEQQLFIDAFNKSLLPNKTMVDVHDGEGNFKRPEDIMIEALFNYQTRAQKLSS